MRVMGMRVGDKVNGWKEIMRLSEGVEGEDEIK